MTAAQLFATAKQADPTLLPAIAQGNFTPLRAWLLANVHEKGSLLSTPDLLTAATGEPLNAKHFKAHLKARYLPS